MRNYLIRRLLLIIPTLMLVTVIVFLLVRFVPGSAIELMAYQQIGESDVDVEVLIDQIKRDLGLDQPIWKQYLRWLGAWPRNDWGGNAVSSVGEVSVTQVDKVDGVAINARAEVFIERRLNGEGPLPKM